MKLIESVESDEPVEWVGVCELVGIADLVDSIESMEFIEFIGVVDLIKVDWILLNWIWSKLIESRELIELVGILAVNWS